MKTIQEVQDDLLSGEVFPIDEFLELVEMGELDDEESYGFYHDGEEETNVKVVLDAGDIEDNRDQYPYVIWHNS